jgi:hypothetical protein
MMMEIGAETLRHMHQLTDLRFAPKPLQLDPMTFPPLRVVKLHGRFGEGGRLVEQRIRYMMWDSIR